MKDRPTRGKRLSRYRFSIRRASGFRSEEESVEALVAEVEPASPAEIEQASARVYRGEASLEIIKAESELVKARAKSLNDAAKREEAMRDGEARRGREDQIHRQSLSQQRFRFYATWTVAIASLIGAVLYLIYGTNGKLTDYSLDLIKIAGPAIVAYLVGRTQGDGKPDKKDGE